MGLFNTLLLVSFVILLYLVIGIVWSTENRRKKWTDDLLQKMAYKSLTQEGMVVTGERLCLRIAELEKYRDHFEKKVDIFLAINWLPFLLVSLKARHSQK